MDVLTNYPEFARDIKASLEGLINDYGFVLFEVYDGCYELRNLKCTFRLTYDRGDISCNIKYPFSKDNQYGYGVCSVFKYLFPNDNSEIENEPVCDPRLQLSKYSKIIKKYLMTIVNGDFSWVDGYLIEQKHFENRIKFIREQLEYNHPIKQKFLNGDISWQKDLDNYLKEHGMKL